MGSCKKGLFVKINMDGVPIGRKIDLGAYDGYQKLFFAVDELFRSLLAGNSLFSFKLNIYKDWYRSEFPLWRSSSKT